MNPDAGANHQICGAYAFALRHPSPTAEYPDAPFNNLNQWPNVTKFPVKPTPGFDLSEHLQRMAAKFYEGTGGAEVVVRSVDGVSVTETVTTVYPNSLINMRDRVVDTVGQESTVLPQWMTTKQTDGRVLGFTKTCSYIITDSITFARIGIGNHPCFGKT